MPTATNVHALRESHYALNVEPPAAAPGATVRLRYRLRNAAAVATPAASMRFLLPPGAAACGELEHALPPIAPGDTSDIVLPVAVAAECDDGDVLIFQAALIAGDDTPRGSNRASLRVAGVPRLDGETSRVELERTDDDEAILVAATVVNDGNASAHHLVLSVPPPAGTEPLDAPHAPEFSFERLAPGARVHVAYRARIVAPSAGVLCADGAFVRDASGTFAALRASLPLVLEPALDPPALTCDIDGRRATVTLRLRNAGWAALEGASVTFRKPAGFRFVRESLTLDGAPPRTLRAAHDGFTLAVERIAQRAETTIVFTMFAAPNASSGEIVVQVHAGEVMHEARAAADWSPRRSFTLAPAQAPPAAVDPGTTASATFALRNDGDRAARVEIAAENPAHALAVDGKARAAHERIPLAAGATARIDLAIFVPLDAADGDRIAAGVRVIDDGACVARAEACIAVRDRVWFDTRAWLAQDDDGARIALTNRGASVARGVRVMLDSGTTIALGDIAPHATAHAPLGEADLAAARRGARAAYGCGRSTELQAPHAAAAVRSVDAALSAPSSLTPGTAASVALRIVCGTAVETLRVRTQNEPHVRISAGSTRLGPHALADGCDGPALGSERGLVLHNLPAAEAVDVAWHAVLDAASAHGEAVLLHASIDADGTQLTCVSAPISVSAVPAFAGTPGALPFLVEGAMLAAESSESSAVRAAPADDPPRALAAPNAEREPRPARDPRMRADAPDDAAAREPAARAGDAPRDVRLGLRLDDDARAGVARLLRGAPAVGLVSHVLALRALFPGVADCSDAGICASLAAAHDALRALLDRLYVKVRIPHFDVTAADCEDLPVRRSVAALYAALAAGSMEPLPAQDGRDVVWTTVTRAAARAVSEALATPAWGAPTALAAIAALLPAGSDAATGGAEPLRSYVAALRDVLGECALLDPDAYEARLARGFEPALDVARTRLLTALEAEGGVAAGAA